MDVQLSVPREAIPHFACWVGAWAMYEPHFNALYEQMQRTNFTVHLADLEGHRKEALERIENYEPNVVDGIAIVSIEGPMMKHQASMSDNVSTVTTRRSIISLANDPTVQGIMVKLCTPGGTVQGTPELGESILFAREKKPVWAYGCDLLASAGYWVGSQCERIETNALCKVGSIGTLNVAFDLSEKASKEGIKVHVLSTGQFKGAFVPGAPITEAHLLEAKNQIEKINGFFLEAIQSGRGFDAEKTKQLADGRVWIGADAVELGLSDGVSKFDDYFGRFVTHCNAQANKYRRSDNPRMQTGARSSNVGSSHSTRVQFSGSQGDKMSESNPNPTNVDARAELQAYTSRFGLELGVDFFQRNVSLADASIEYSTKVTAQHKTELERVNKEHAEAIAGLNGQLAAVAKERDEYKAKLEAAKISIGEPTAVDTGKPAPNGAPGKSFGSFIRPASPTK